MVSLWYRPPELLLGENVYCCGVDMWSMGCVFAEIATGVKLFHGDCEIDQLFRIFRMKGVPTEESWPGVTNLRNYNAQSFPSWYTNRLCSEERVVRALDAEGVDLLTVRDHCVPPFLPLFSIVTSILLSSPLFSLVVVVYSRDDSYCFVSVVLLCIRWELFVCLHVVTT